MFGCINPKYHVLSDATHGFLKFFHPSIFKLPGPTPTGGHLKLILLPNLRSTKIQVNMTAWQISGVWKNSTSSDSWIFGYTCNHKIVNNRII
jgi:hypothetical protein